MNFLSSKSYKHKKILSSFLSVIIFVLLLSGNTSVCLAVDETFSDAETRKTLPIQSNDIAGWPEGPEIGAQAAILMDINTGTILYAKNIHQELYPASTTKIMTCLLAVENASLDETIEFSTSAVSAVPADGSNIGIDAGEYLPLEDCLYGIMVGSANEVANAVGEHVSGSIDKFVDLMNERAKSLGCTNTHFNNTNGLQDSNHYTSAYDLALISAKFFSNALLCRVGNTARYHFTKSAGQPDDFYLNNKHKLITGEISYPGIVGGKTGYTDLARETLVTCAEQNGMKLVCVVFMEESPEQFNDTVTLFDYGFNNFKTVNIRSEETSYIPEDHYFFSSENDIFVPSGTILEFNKSDYCILPQNASLSDTTSTVTYDSSSESTIAQINYFYNDTPVGKGHIIASTADSYDDSSNDVSSMGRVIYINIKQILTYTIGAALIVIAIIYIADLISSYSFGGSREARRRVTRRKKEAKKRNGPRF